MTRLLLVLALWLSSAAPAAAQCVLSVPPSAVWPTAVTFDPASPVAGQPVAALLTPNTEAYWQGVPPVRTGNIIDITQFLVTFLGTPPPAQPLRIELGALPAGQYLVRFRLSGQGGQCAPLDATLFVAGASVPANGRVGLALLAVLLGLIATRAARVGVVGRSLRVRATSG